MKRRVVVTGMGAITPVGNDVAATWRAITEGVSGGAPITKFDHSTFPVHFACEVKGFDPLLYLERKEAKRADLFAQYAIAASVQAMSDAGFDDTSKYDPERTGVIIGSGIGGLKTFEEQHDVYRERGQSKISAFFIPMFISDIAAGLVSMRFNAKGPNYATISACATSANANGHRRLREHEGVVGAERFAGHGVASLRCDARRLRHGRGRRHRHPRGARARQGARRHHLRRGRGLWSDRRCVSSHRAGAGG